MAELSLELAALGRAVRQMRFEAALSQEALGEAADLHRTYVGGIERGERNISFTILLKLASGLGRRPSEVIERFELAISDPVRPPPGHPPRSPDAQARARERG